MKYKRNKKDENDNDADDKPRKRAIKKRAAADKSTTRVGPLATQHKLVTPQQKLKSAMGKLARHG